MGSIVRLRSLASCFLGDLDETYINLQILYADVELDLSITTVSKSKIPQSAIEANLEYSDLRLNGSEVAAFGHLEGFSYPASKGIISMAFDDTRGLDFAVLAKLALDLYVTLDITHHLQKINMYTNQ